MRRCSRLKERGILDNLREGNDILVVRQDRAHRFARLADDRVRHHRIVGKYEIGDKILHTVEAADIAERFRHLDGLLRRHRLNDLVDVADDGGSDDELAVSARGLFERDVGDIPEHGLHLFGEARVVVIELGVIGVEHRLAVAKVFAADSTFGHLLENAGVVVAIYEFVQIKRVARFFRENKRGELAREARPFARKESAFEVVVVNHAENVLEGALSDGFRVYDRAPHKTHGEGFGIHLEVHSRREAALADNRMQGAVVVLDEFHSLAGEAELLRLAHIRRQHLERRRNETLEGVDEIRMLPFLVVYGVLAGEALVARGLEVFKIARRGKKRYGVGYGVVGAGDVAPGAVLPVDNEIGPIARELAGFAHTCGFLGRLEVVVREILHGFLRITLAASRILVEKFSHKRAGKRHIARLENFRAADPVVCDIHLRRKTEPLANLIHVLFGHFRRLERVQERLLHLENALRREHDVVLARLPDMVVDLDELCLAAGVRLEVNLSGVVAAGRDAVELREAYIR